MQILRGLSSPDNLPVALTIGNFDGVHRGHRALLAQLRAVASQHGLLATALVFEPHSREFFTPQQAPARLTSLREKLECFESLGLDRVVVCHFDAALANMSPDDFIQALRFKLHADFVLVGDDFRFGKQRGGDFSLLHEHGARLGFSVQAMDSVLLDTLRVSSTSVRQALARGDLAFAANLLGRPYSMSGRVEHGQRIGHRLGFPTANIQLKHNLSPLTGIFVVRVRIEMGEWREGVASLGVRPTVESGGAQILEVHLFDFSDDIYEKHVHVDFLHKLRDEMKFDGLEELKRQIARDVERAKEWFVQHG